MVHEHPRQKFSASLIVDLSFLLIRFFGTIGE